MVGFGNQYLLENIVVLFHDYLVVFKAQVDQSVCLN